MKKVAISQSNYIPWIGYFDVISKVDEFILFDSAQFTRRDWRNRNKIYTSRGLEWLTVPVVSKGKFTQTIYDTTVSDLSWGISHWSKLYETYRKSSFYSDMSKHFEEFYLENKEKSLSKINYNLIQTVCDILEINTKISFCQSYQYTEGCATTRLMQICKSAGADTYLSGPAAKDYFDIELATRENIAVEWMHYPKYKSYKQLYNPFEIGVSVLDLLFNVGNDAKNYL